MLSDVSGWYRDEQKYSAEAIGTNYYGFLRQYSPTPGIAPKPEQQIDHKMYKTAAQKWYGRLVDVSLTSRLVFSREMCSW